MANKLQQLTNTEKDKVLSGTSKVLPLKPSDNGWTAEQIREKGYKGIETLFDLLDEVVKNTIDDLNGKVEESELNTKIQTINNAIETINNNVEEMENDYTDRFVAIGVKLVELQDKINHISIEGDFATKEDLQNVIEIAEGKTKSYLLSCNDIIQEEFLPYMTYYNARGEVLTSEQVMNIVNNGTCVNNLFNSQDNQVPVWDVSNWYLIIEYNYPVMQNNSKVIITNMDNPFKQGDILIVTETDVPDRYATDIGIFYKMETAKVDLSTVVHKSGDETIEGIKTFTNGIKIGNSWFLKENYNNLYIGLGNNDNKFEFANGSLRLDGDFNSWGTHDLGKNGAWKDLYLSNALFTTFVKDSSGNTYFSLATDTIAWKNIRPASENLLLGTENNYWKTGYINEIKSTGDAQYKKVQCLTQDEYDALSTKDENVLYLIKE